MPTTAESSASQVEAETSHPRRRLGRPRGARNLLTIEERQHNKKVLAKAYYERTKEYKKMQRRLSEEKKSNGQVNSMEEGPGGRAGQASTIEEKETNRVDGPSHSQGSYNGHSLDRTLDSFDRQQSYQWRLDRQAQAMRFTQLGKMLAEEESDHHVTSNLSKPRRRESNSTSQASLSKSRVKEIYGKEKQGKEETLAPSSSQGETSDDNTDEDSDDNKVKSTSPWIPLSMRSPPIGLPPRSQRPLGFLARASEKRGQPDQALMY
ncbi:hypothetical protein MMC16_007799 [Acarospora aff. strigata]|nr:hypothetical protein [Acarospora aff. strigata]